MRRHDTARIIQCLLRFGAEDTRAAVLETLKGTYMYIIVLHVRREGEGINGWFLWGLYLIQIMSLNYQNSSMPSLLSSLYLNIGKPYQCQLICCCSWLFVVNHLKEEH